MTPRGRLLLLPLFALLGWVLAGAAEDRVDLSGATDLYAKGHYAAARTALERLHREQPQNPELVFQLGNTCRRLGRLDEAVLWYEEAARLAPENTDFLVALGDAYGDLADAQASFALATKARDTLQKAVALAPKNAAARHALITFYRKAPAYAGGGMDKAFQQAQEFRQLDPLAGTLELIALHEKQKAFEAAFGLCEETLRDHPGDYGLLFLKGHLAATARTRLDDGVTALQQCLAVTPPTGAPSHARARVELGRLFMLKSDLAEARRQFQAALAEEPANREALAGLRAISAAQTGAG